ncbi:hypothetical protein [Lactovum odontotermitis]
MKLKSDLTAAQGAIALFKSDEQKGQQGDVEESNIDAITQGISASNQMLGSVSSLESSTKLLADCIPELAAVIEARDKLDAVEISKMNWGF